MGTLDRLARGLLPLQALLGARVVLRLVRTARGETIRPAPAPPGERVDVLVPVLNEVGRLGPCLDGLTAQGPEVARIVVVDGGSTDGTPALVRAAARRDRRIELVEAGPAPPDWNGKVWNLQAALDRASPTTGWILTIDADVRPKPGLVAALLAQARRRALAALSVATRQELSGPAEGLVHPALLATLVYRFGIPGHATRTPSAVQANGQCFLVRREALDGSGGFAAVRGSLSEDVTLARRLARAGQAVGFYETAGLVSVAMYAGAREAWGNWARSLPLRDEYWGWTGPVGLAEVALVQALPLPLAALLVLGRWRGAPLALNAALVAVRLGVLAGMSRAYVRRPWTYWLSPLLDLPVAVQLIASALRRRHTWRGRVIERR